MKLNYLVLIFLLLLSGCASDNEPSHRSVAEMHALQLIYDVAEEINEETGLILVSESSRIYDEILNLGFRFEMQKRATIEEARNLIVYVSEKMQEAFNAAPSVRPFLVEHPLPMKLIGVSIVYSDIQNHRISDGSVAYVSNFGCHLDYSKFDAYHQKFIDLHAETYDDAAELAKASDKGFSHSPTPFEWTFDRLMAQLYERINDQKTLNIWGIGCQQCDQQLEEFDIIVTCFKKMHQEEARRLHLEIIQEVLETCEREGLPLRPEQIKFKLNFRKKNYFSYADGSLESVQSAGGILTYYKRNAWKDHNDPKIPYEYKTNLGSETYEEALRWSATGAS